MADEHKPAQFQSSSSAEKGPNVGLRTTQPQIDGAKTATGEKSYTLRQGHPTPFRRTVTLDGGNKTRADKASRSVKPENVQLIFEPGQDYQLSAEEVAGVQDLIDGGLLVEATRDEKGRLRPVSTPRTDADSVIDRLEKKVEEQAAENAELKAEIKKLSTPPKTGA